jgi:hypothetical protein
VTVMAAQGNQPSHRESAVHAKPSSGIRREMLYV